jgi:hypothetical protein
MAVPAAIGGQQMKDGHPGERLTGERVAFLVGAGRSGTTLLHKLLCLHPQIAYISNYENRFAWFPDGLACGAIAQRLDEKLDAWFDKGGNAYFVKRPWLKKLFPTPNEGESVFRACGMPLIPTADYRPDAATTACLRGRFEQIRQRSKAAIFLSKRTANNRRIPQLAEIFPEARYVHLIRDGRDVAQSLSTVEWWDQHQVWWDGRTPLEMEHAGEARLAVCARNWVREEQELQTHLAAIAPRRLLVLRFEELLRDPRPLLERVLQFLGVEFTEAYRKAIELLNLQPVRAKWSTEWDADQLGTVLKEVQPLLAKLGYGN